MEKKENNCEGEYCPTCARKSERYYGWANYETWVVNLWLTNDEGTYRQVLHLRAENDDLYRYAERIREYVEEMKENAALNTKHNPLTDASLFSDLLNAALAKVDFAEVAKAFAGYDGCTERRAGRTVKEKEE